MFAGICRVNVVVSGSKSNKGGLVMTKEYTIKEKEREFYRYLYKEVEQFKEAIKEDDTRELKQDTCDVMRLIVKNVI
jgi:hypothetical protein